MIEDLRSLGFRRALILDWNGIPPKYVLSPTDEDDWRVKNVVYAWVDTRNWRCLNVGQTGQSLRARFKHYSGYENWLNGGRVGDVHTPVRKLWLKTLATCDPRQVEVWIVEASSDKEQRLSKEQELIRELRPQLNRLRGTSSWSQRTAQTRALAAVAPTRGSSQIDRLPAGLREACKTLLTRISQLPEIQSGDADRYVGLKLRGRLVCQLHAKPKRRYVWVHVPAATYNARLTFESPGYLQAKNETRFRFGSATDLEEAVRVCREAYNMIRAHA